MTTIELKYIEDILEYMEESVIPSACKGYGSNPRMRPEDGAIYSLKIAQIRKGIKAERSTKTN